MTETYLDKLEQWARKICQEEKRQAEQCGNASQRAYHIGRKTLAAAFLKRIAKAKTEKKTDDARPMWCIECLWTGDYKDACDPKKSALACPRCGDELSLRSGTGPRNT